MTKEMTLDNLEEAKEKVDQLIDVLPFKFTMTLADIRKNLVTQIKIIRAFNQEIRRSKKSKILNIKKKK